MSDEPLELKQTLLALGISVDLQYFFERLRSEGQINFDAVASEPGRLLEIHLFLKSYLRDLYTRADLTVQMAREEVNLRRQADAPNVSFDEYSKTGRALIDLVHSEMEAVRPILHALLDAYREMGIPESELWRFFEAETKFIFRRFPLIPYRFQELMNDSVRSSCLGRPGLPFDDIDYKAIKEVADPGSLPEIAIAFPVLEADVADDVRNSTPICSPSEPVIARGKAEETLSSAEPLISNSSDKVSGYRNIEVSKNSEEFFPLRPNWDPQCHAIVRTYVVECQRAGLVVTIASLCKAAKVHKTVFYDFLSGQLKSDSAPATRIRRVCQNEKPHLKKEFAVTQN